MFSPEIVAGCQTLLTDYIKPNIGDGLLVLYSPECRDYVALLALLAKQDGLKVSCMPMRPLQDANVAKRFSDSLKSCFDRLGQGTLYVVTFERDTMSHQAAIQSSLAVYPEDRVRLIRAISVCDEFFSVALQASPAHLSVRNSKILAHCWGKTDMKVTTKSGSRLEISFDNERYSWVNNRGSTKSGGTTILPAGEVATFPATISGRLVADFAYNVNAINSLDSRLDKTPVTVDIVDGKAVSFHCESKPVSDFIDICFSKNNAKYVGEVGFGTNLFVETPIYLNSHINERCPGIHLGFGQHNQMGASPGYHCEIHLDLIARGARLEGERGVLDLLSLSQDGSVSDFDTRDEDVFSPEFEDLDVGDCCGILNEQGFQPFVIA
ncbi:MAG: hypothetical protein ACSHX3_14250 [Litorimonas sp.]